MNMLYALYPTRRSRNQTPVADLGARASRPQRTEGPIDCPCGRDARALRTRQSRKFGIREPAAGRRIILRRFVEDFTDKGLK